MGTLPVRNERCRAVFVFAYAPPALNAGYYSRAACAKPSSSARKRPPTRRLLHDVPGLAMAQPRDHPCRGDGGPSTIYNAREFVEAGGVMCYGPNASDLFRRSADGREGGGQQAVSSLNEWISFRARNAYSKTPLIPAKAESRPRTWVTATGSPPRECRGVPLAGTRREGGFLPRPGNKNTHSSVVVHGAARPFASKLYGLRASRPRDQDAGIDRDHPPRDFGTARRDRIGTDYGRSNAEASVAYRTIQSHCKAGKGALNSQGLAVALARAAHRRQT